MLSSVSARDVCWRPLLNIGARMSLSCQLAGPAMRTTYGKREERRGEKRKGEKRKNSFVSFVLLLVMFFSFSCAAICSGTPPCGGSIRGSCSGTHRLTTLTHVHYEAVFITSAAATDPPTCNCSASFTGPDCMTRMTRLTGRGVFYR